MYKEGRFIVIKCQEIEDGLRESSRQYLVGNLALSQIIQHISEEDLEIGITDYNEKTQEKPHWHLKQKEYQYVISGITQYRIIGTEDIMEFKQGDFYAIYPSICYEQISEAGTRILFIKVPSINDKMDCNNCERMDCIERGKWSTVDGSNCRG
jgi:8-oxo-dGTP diphosphatase